MSWQNLIIRGASITCNVAGCSQTAHVRCAFNQVCQSLAISSDQCSFNQTGATLPDQVCSCGGLATGGGGVWGSLQPPHWDDVRVVNELKLWWGSLLNKASTVYQLAATFVSELARPEGVLSPEKIWLEARLPGMLCLRNFWSILLRGTVAAIYNICIICDRLF